MPVVQWDYEKYKVEIDEMDRQHKKLFDIVNELYNAHTKNQTSKQNIKKIFYKLMDFIFTHFEAEEKLLKKYDYPDIEAHKEKHNDFKNHINEKYTTLLLHNDENENVESSIPLELIIFLIDWIRVHTLEIDKEYADYLKKSGLMEIEIKEVENENEI